MPKATKKAAEPKQKGAVAKRTKRRAAPTSPTQVRLGPGGAPIEDGRAPKSEGQRLLLLETRSLAELAEALGVTRQAVHAWQTGINAPSRAGREKLEVVCSIPLDAWARAAENPEAPTPPEPSATVESDGTKLGDVEHQLSLVRAQRTTHTLVPRELRDNIELEHKLLERRDRLEQEREAITWARGKKLILAALLPFPDASRALIKALEELE